jgi:cysteinyl-tRNA synthetase
LDAAPHRARFTDAMDDDFNSAQAVAGLFDLAREINRCREDGCDVAAAQRALRDLCGVLGLSLTGRQEAAGDAGPFIDLLVQLRAELRARKEWAVADVIRNGLAERGVTLEDTAGGTTWKRRRD